jgi:benzoate/toluate 1,2-dioxygenase subunit alpha
MLDAPPTRSADRCSVDAPLRLSDLPSAPAARGAGSALSRDALQRLRTDLLDPALRRLENNVFLGARNIYTDRELFDLEMTHLFEGGWVYAAHESQMPKPHDFMSFTVGRQPVLLTRDASGALGGFFNACMHRGARLCREKVGNRKVHMCRFHGWCYNNRGELVNVTAEKEGAYPPGFDRKDFGLVRLPHVESYRGFIFVSLAPVELSLKAFLGDAARFIDLLVDQSPTAELEVLSGETSYTYSGNWKLAAENGVDGYHVPTVHQNYLMTVAERAKAATAGAPTKTFDISKWGQGEAGFFGFDHGHALLYGPYFNHEDRPSFPQYEHYAKALSPEHADWIVKRFRNLLLMPNVLLMDQMSSQIRLIRPVSVDLTEVVTWCIAPKGEAPHLRERRIRQYEDFFNASGMATPDDMAEFRNCQIGYGASGVAYSDLSRGQQRWVQGANETAQRFGLHPRLSSTQTADEGIYVSILEQWRDRMNQAVERELGRAPA